MNKTQKMVDETRMEQGLWKKGKSTVRLHGRRTTEVRPLGSTVRHKGSSCTCYVWASSHCLLHTLSLAASPMDMDCQTLRHTSATAFAGLILKLNSHNSSLRRTGVHSVLADNPNFRTVCSIRLHTAASTVVSGAHIPILAFSSVLCESLRRRLYGTTLTQAPLCGKSDSEAV